MAGAGPVTEHSESEGEVGPMEEFLERESNETMMDYEWPACARKVAAWNSDTAKKEVAAAGGFSVRGATLHLPRAACDHLDCAACFSFTDGVCTETHP